MTIISGIETSELKTRKSEMRSALLYNDKIEEKLNVIMVISNPCNFKKRWQLAKRFIKHMNEFSNDIELYICELIYDNQKFQVTEENNPNHLQLKTKVPLWHKENMINCAVNKLLPNNWKAFAYIDADLEFENPNWASDTLKILNGSKDIIQLFSHCIDMNKNENTMSIFQSFGYQYDLGKPYCNKGLDLFHCGYAWALTRKAYNIMGGIFEYSILGSGDYNMAMGILNNENSIDLNNHESYKKIIKELCKKMCNLRLGYIPNVIRHYYHGEKKNRKYTDRWKILVKHQYNPYIHIIKNEDGILVPTYRCPQGLLDDILKYFQERNEDN